MKNIYLKTIRNLHVVPKHAEEFKSGLREFSKTEDFVLIKKHVSTPSKHFSPKLLYLNSLGLLHP